jgi:cytochrome P450
MDPIHRSMGMWVLTRYSNVKSVMADLRFSSSQIPELVKLHGQKAGRDIGPIESLARKSIVFTDRPEHPRLRRLVGPPFTGKAADSLRPHIEEIAGELLDKIGGSGTVDFIAEFANLLPLHVMSDMMNLPAEIRPEISEWTHRIRCLLEPGLMSKGTLDRVHQTLLEYMAYFQSVIEDRRRTPGSDLVSELLASRAGADLLSDEEVIFACVMTFVAGHETTKCLIGNGMLALLENPDQLALLRQSPELMASATAEMLRYESPLQQTKRVATEDVELDGHLIKRGDAVLLCIGAANHDPEQFEAPDRFDIRRPSTAHIAFGHGIHRCLGAPLAQLEAQIAFETILRRWRGMTLAADSVQWLDHSFILRGLKALPISFETS